MAEASGEVTGPGEARITAVAADAVVEGEALAAVVDMVVVEAGPGKQGYGKTGG